MNSQSTKINLLHVAMIGPILYYIGNKGKDANLSAYVGLSTLTISILFFVKNPNLKNYKGIIRSIHYFLYIPLFLYISNQNKNLPEWVFHFIKYLGISVSMIHLYLLYRKKFN